MSMKNMKSQIKVGVEIINMCFIFKQFLAKKKMYEKKKKSFLTARA